MAALGRLTIAAALISMVLGVSALAVSSSSPETNRVSAEDDSIDSRPDHPNLDDLSSFFDFELVPPSPGATRKLSKDRKYYYYYRPGGPMYPEHQFVAPPDKDSAPGQQVVTPGTHYKAPNVTNEPDRTVPQAVIGSYQVSVVDADSPVLSDLGLSKDDLQKLTSMTRRTGTTQPNLQGSDSVPSATYAEHPRPEYPTHHHDSKYNSYPRPSEYYPADRGQHPHHPPPQGSYDAKSYAQVQGGSGYGGGSGSYAPHSSAEHHNQHYHPASYPPKRAASSGEPWRATHPQSHTDWDDKNPKKNEGYHPHGSYHPPSSSQQYYPAPPPSSPPSSHYHPRHSYSTTTEKPGYRYPSSYKYPTSYKPSYGSSSSEYKAAPHRHSYPPKSSSPPSRAGSSYTPHEEASKPGITIRFKAKTPGGGGGGGLNIPVNFNPLDVVKKLIPLASLNPLNNKKVTIGITIENKKEEHQHGY